MKKIKFWPIFLSTTFVILINVINLFVDEVVLSRHYNDTAFAAKNLSEPILWCVPFLSGILCTGAVRAYLNAKAAKDRKRADISFSQGLWTSVMLGFILATVMLLGRKTLVDLVAGEIAGRDHQAVFAGFCGGIVGGCHAVDGRTDHGMIHPVLDPFAEHVDFGVQFTQRFDILCSGH